MLFTKHENKFSVLLIIRRGARYMCSDGRGSVFINIDPSSGLPIYLQIAQQIKTAVAMGRLQPEGPLPSVRQLAPLP
jgi:hypothetical protein